MSIRSVKFVPAVIAGVVAGSGLATTTDLRAQVLTTSAEAAIPAPQVAADSCLSAPNGATPAGSHWYYRLDRVTKRQCWYLREEGDATDDKFARAAPPAPDPSLVSAQDEPAPQHRANGRKSLSDARAEWQPRSEANPPARIERTAVPAGPAPVVEPNNPRMAMPNVLAPAPLASMRWNDAVPSRGSVNPTDVQFAAAAPSAADPPQVEEVQPTPIASQTAFARTEAATARPTASLQKLLIVMVAALALAGLTVSAIVRIGRMRARRAMRRKRRAMWDTAKNAKMKRRATQPQVQPQPMFRDEDAVSRRASAVATPRMVSPTRPPRERPQQERPYAPQERRHAPQDRMTQHRASKDYAAPPDRDRERQMTEMLSRLARTAHS